MSTAVAGPASQTSATPGTAVTAIASNQSGGYITNPLNPADQGLVAAEPLFVNQVTNAALAANGTTVALQPGETYQVVPNTITPVTASAASPNHKFTSVQWV
jgi:hypothetical protein